LNGYSDKLGLVRGRFAAVVLHRMHLTWALRFRRFFRIDWTCRN